MPAKEAHARIKINTLLESAGWRFFSDAQGPANVVLESHAVLTRTEVDAMGNDFETIASGFVDFLLLDAHGYPLVVLEAKAEGKNPLVGKEQARKYAKSQNRSRLEGRGAARRLHPEKPTAFLAPVPAARHAKHSGGGQRRQNPLLVA